MISLRYICLHLKKIRKNLANLYWTHTVETSLLSLARGQDLPMWDVRARKTGSKEQQRALMAPTPGQRPSRTQTLPSHQGHIY